MKLLSERRELFEGKDILDIGCNTGLLTLWVAKELGARTVIGVEIDRGLVDIARASLSHYSARGAPFPLSMPKLYGSIQIPGVATSPAFPHNVSFVQVPMVLSEVFYLFIKFCAN